MRRTEDFSWKEGKVGSYKLYSPAKQRAKVMIDGVVKEVEVGG